GLVVAGAIEPADLFALGFMPFVWGVVTGLGLTVWAYEPQSVRRVGEFIAIAGVLVYLVVGILAAENLKLWLQKLPQAGADAFYSAFLFMHESNPFGVMRPWFAPGRTPVAVWNRFEALNLAGLGLAGLFALRAASRLKGHFHDRHYKPID